MEYVDRVISAFKWLLELWKPENLRALVNLGGPEWVSYCILFAIVFSETGLLVGFFLPGDSLLFTAGLLASGGVFNIVILDVVLMFAAILGDAVNYWLGARLGELVFERGRLRLVKYEHLMAAKAFYEKHGGKAIILARFVPLVRTFTPFVAGVARMRYAQFAVFNICGGVAWVLSMTFCGYFLGQLPFIREHFELVVLTIVFISLLPVLIPATRHGFERWRRKPAPASLLAEQATTTDVLPD